MGESSRCVSHPHFFENTKLELRWVFLYLSQRRKMNWGLHRLFCFMPYLTTLFVTC